MASRRLAWTLAETNLLIESYDRPIQMLEQMFPRHSKSSIQRKLARLREQNKIGYKSSETTSMAHKLAKMPRQ